VGLVATYLPVAGVESGHPRVPLASGGHRYRLPVAGRDPRHLVRSRWSCRLDGRGAGEPTQSLAPKVPRIQELTLQPVS
jgi:hypothetical protein